MKYIINKNETSYNIIIKHIIKTLIFTTSQQPYLVAQRYSLNCFEKIRKIQRKATLTAPFFSKVADLICKINNNRKICNSLIFQKF